MADPRTSFTVLEDVSTQAGVPLHKAVEGDAHAGKNAYPALVYKDAAENLVYGRVDANGAVLVTSEGITECKRARGELAAGSAALALVTSAEITLVADTEYQEIGFLVACRRDSLFQIIWQDDAVETILGEIIVGSGAYTVAGQLHCLSFTAGSTGTQKLKVKAMNFEALSSLRASITVEEVQ